MKKRILSMLLALIMALSLVPVTAFAAATLEGYFDGLPVIAETEPGTPGSTNKWKVTTLDGEDVLISGNAGKSSSSSTLQLTFTSDVHMTFEYKVSSEARYDKCTITLGSTTLVNGESGDQSWKPLEIDAKSGDVLQVVYKKDSSTDKNDDCVYLRNFSAGTPLLVTLHANNGTDDTVQQKIYGGKGTLPANSWTYVGIAADGTIQYKWNPNGTTSASEGNVRPTVVLSCQGTDGKTYTRESTGCYFIIGLDEAKAMAALRTVADRITVPETVESADDLTSLPKYPLKAGVDAGSVDYNESDDLELWTTAAWSSSDTAVISVSDVSDPYFSPYKATVTLPKQDTSVTLTLTLTYNGREDLTVSRVYTVDVKRDTTPRELDYQALLEAALTEYGLHDPQDSASIDTASVTSDIQFPTTRQLNTIACRDYNQDFDGKYTPILLCTSDDSVIVSADPATANVARMVTYRPLPGQSAKTVTVTVKILSRPSGEGKDYDSMTVLASKDITLTVQPLTQDELDAASAFMTKVCTEDVYWEGIRKANSDRDRITGDMRSFIEIVPDGDGYKFVRDMDAYNAVGVKADDIPGWYDAQQYRCFRSSNSAVVSHENLLLTQPKYNTRITIDSVLTYTEYAKYYEKFQSDPAYTQFAKFYKQPISTTVTVIGTEGIEDPNLQPITVTVNVDGNGFGAFASLTGGSYTCTAGDGRTAADALLDVLARSGYTYSGTPGYITGITDPNGNALSSGDKAYGPWSGWMFTVNGEMPILGADEDGNTLYATLDKYQLQKDDVIRLYFVACPSESGNHVWDNGTVTKAAACTEDGVLTYTCTVCGGSKTEVIPAAGHDTELRGVKSATCTEDGFTGDLVCKSCGTVVTPGEVIPAAGHTDADGNGKCDVCGAEVGTQPTDPTQPTEPTTPEQPVQPENPADDSSVKTGDNTHLTLWLSALGLTALAGCALLRRKKIS